MFKGLFMHSFAKIIFVLCSYAIHLYLGKTLSPAEYGIVGVIITIITLNYNFLSNGARQAASRSLATKKYNEQDIVKKSISLQFMVAILLALINYMFSKQISEILNTPSLEPFIKMTAFIIPFTAGYFCFIGIFNGLQLFVLEATIVTIYSFSRLAVIPFVGIVFNNGALGTVTGFFTASFSVFIICLFILIFKIKKILKYRENDIPPRTFIQNATNFLLFFTFVTIILNIDMLFVNAFVENQNYVGYYTGAVNFAKVSYYLLSAVYIVALPTVTQEYAQNNFTKAQNTIKNLFTTILLFILPVVSITGASSGNLLSSFYKSEYRVASTTATILMISQFFIGLFVVLNMFITATHSKRFSPIVAMFITIINIILCAILIPIISIKGAAIASVITSSLGCMISFYKTHKLFGNIWGKKMVLLLVSNLILAITTGVIHSFWIVDNLFLLFVFYIVIYVFFVALMIILKIVDIDKIAVRLHRNR